MSVENTTGPTGPGPTDDGRTPPSGPASRRRPALMLLALLAVLVSVAVPDDEAITHRALLGALTRATADVATLANLRGEGGGPGEGPPGGLPVAVVLEGDAPWLLDQAQQVVARDPAFAVADGPHQLQFEYVHDARTWAVRAQLWRQGWRLSPPSPVVVRVFPFVAVLALALGGALWARRVPLAWACATAAMMAQAGLWLMPWPRGLLRPSFADTLADGPLGRVVVGWAQSLPDASFAGGAGLVALCLVLVVFDHRRSPGRGGRTVATGLVTLVSLGVWSEAALRAQVPAWAGTGLGVVGAVGLLVLWGGQAWARRSSVRQGAR